MAFLPFAAASYFTFVPRNLIWAAYTALWGIAFLFFVLFYFPMRYHKLSYAIEDGFLVVHCGVIYRRQRTIALDSIQYTTVIEPPFHRIFHVCIFLAHAAGGRVMIPGMSLPQACALQKSLSGSQQGRRWQR